MKNLFGLIILSSICLSLNAAKPKYPIASIPTELRKNAKAVVRYSNEILNVRSDNRATFTKEYALSILNNDALNYADLSLPYSSFSRISDMEITIYDESGNKVRRIPSAEIVDYLAYDGFSIYHDNRIKYLDSKYQTVPFTVEVSYTINYKSLFYYPDWVPNMTFDFSVEEAQFTIISPSDNKVRYKEQNLPSQVTITPMEDHTHYTWNVKHLDPIKYEPYNLPLSEFAPIVYTAATNFKMDKYEGSMESWDQFGEWISQLNEDKDSLSAETISMLRDLVADASTTEEKVHRIYSYLQNNTRYVSIQIGIGGLQPFDAETIDRLKYGDCKALSNYMKAMLKAIGIHSEYALIRAGRSAPRMMKNFPSSQFNHAFLCVPLATDTLWLECTSQHMPCGFLGDFDDDRDVLLITEDGGKIARTPCYTADNNLQSYTATVQLCPKGNARATMQNTFNGIRYNEQFGLLIGDETDKKKRLYKRISIPNFRVNSYEHSEIRERIPSLLESLNLDLDGYCSQMGNRLIVPLNLINQQRPLPRSRDERLSDVFIRRSLLDHDSIVFQIPTGYRIEGLPENKELSSDFGSYQYTVEATDSTITYLRTQRVNKGTFAKERYQEYYEYIEKVATMDNAKAVLIREEDITMVGE